MPYVSQVVSFLPVFDLYKVFVYPICLIGNPVNIFLSV